MPGARGDADDPQRPGSSGDHAGSADERDNAAKKDKPAAKDDDDEDDKDEDGEAEHKGLLQRPILLISGGVLLVAALVGGLVFWLNARHFQSTDDAFVDAHIVRLAPQVAGRVTQVLVNDNERVRANQPLVVIDSSDLETRVAQAEAQRAQAKAQMDNARVQIAVNQAGYQQALAEVASAEAQADNARRDFDRYQTLQKSNPAALAQQQYDQAQAQARQTTAQRDSAVKAAKGKADQIKASRAELASGADQVRAAQAQLNEAGINLGYARIVAPVAGHVAQKSVAAGNYVQPGTQLLAIVPLDIWITANFKETQLALMRVGQHVDVHVDACPGEKIQGHVDSIQRGAGQAFAILPPENATGNYVKVVQRVPVKIVLDNPPADCPLGPGMSVEPQVRVR
jgi:membrane fusion protein, multidrug efflux system